jgi:transposase
VCRPDQRRRESGSGHRLGAWETSITFTEALAPLVVQLRNLDEAIARLDRILAKPAQKDETARRLMSIPGFGPIAFAILRGKTVYREIPA